MASVKITKYIGSNIGYPRKKVVYNIVARNSFGFILAESNVFTKSAATKKAAAYRKKYLTRVDKFS